MVRGQVSVSDDEVSVSVLVSDSKDETPSLARTDEEDHSADRSLMF